MPIETITKAGRRRYRWTFERVIEGTRIRKTKILPPGISAKAADELARKWESEQYEIAAGARKPVVTIGECVMAHFADKSSGWKDAKKRMQILEKWAPEFAEQDALDLHEWSKSFVGYLRAATDHRGVAKHPLTDGAIRNVLAYIRAAIKYAHKVGRLETDQTARMVIPGVNNERHHYPQRREMLEIARACEDRQVRAAIRIAFYSGMRRGEILRAKVTRSGYSLDDSKNGRPRIIPIHPRIAVLARRVRFTIPVWKFEDGWQAARVAAGYPTTKFHDLRHGAASEMINAGIDLFTVGGVLGHKSTVSTKRYSHLVTDRLADAVARIGQKR
ncbi:tyrosine-type recombinase/integrase [Paraburkholderia sp. CNPSo 3157]|uniref:Tyrosine-type recombinase/integrase n=1 Tax=Paraburkholderia franconis TaxID=2654983 RepID=A0A7X1NAD0_9BURK|nr:site-specific integrase [Paraburkholderia franconis]MPW17926.1 tyrosine-type recombinase/integrase [Paraburkholderia franconis]